MSEAALAKLKQRLTPVQALVLVLAILPACLQGIVILKYGVNMPMGDDWMQVWLFQKASEGTLSFDDLMRQHNEGRLFFPNLVNIALAFLTNWDLRYQMFISFLLACLISFNVYRLGKLTIEGSRLKRLTIFLLSNLFIFAPIQAEQVWLWGFEYIVFVPIACITTCLLVAYSNLGTKTKLLACLLLATVSTFSFPNGMSAWILVFPVIASSRTWGGSPRKGWLVLAWLAGFALNVAFYFYGYQTPPEFGDPYEALFYPVQALQFFLSFLGAPYSFGLPNLISSAPYVCPTCSHHAPTQAVARDLATILGAMLLFLFVALCVYLLASLRNSLVRYQALGWVMIGAYSIISALPAAFGRVVSEGVEGALALRYPPIQLYLAVSLVHLIPIVLGNVAREEDSPSPSRLFSIALGCFRRRRFITAFGSSLIVIVVSLHLLTSVYWVATLLPTIPEIRSNQKACLLLVEVVQDECITNKLFGPGVNALRPIASIANNLGFLTPPLVESDKIRDIEGARPKSANYGYFDVLTKTDEDSYLAGGWAVSPEEKRPADAVLLTYEDVEGEPTVFAVSDTRTERPDVAESLGIDEYTRSGWQESFTPSAVPAGSTEIAAWAFDVDTKRAFKLDNTHVLEQPHDSLEAAG